MDFPITELLSRHESVCWLEQHFHPHGLHCSHCGAARAQARLFRHTRSGFAVYRCCDCQGIYTVLSGTVWAGCCLAPARIVLLLRGFCQGQSSARLARELKLSRTTVLLWRRKLQQQAQHLAQVQAQEPLADEHCETAEMFQNAGGKGEPHHDPQDPPRRRANKKKGHGTYDNDRPLTMIGHRSWARSDVPVGSAACKYAGTPMVLPCALRCSGTPQPGQPATATSGRATAAWSGRTGKSSMAKSSGRGTLMGTASTRCIPTASRACGRVCATGCVRSVVCISVTCRATSLCANMPSTINASRRTSSRS